MTSSTTTTIHKTTRFDMIAPGTTFTCAQFGAISTYVKVTARTAQGFPERGIVFSVKPSTLVTVEDVDAMEREAKRLAKPLFDGTEASCRSREDFYALDEALRQVVVATENLDEMADFIAQKMSDIKFRLRGAGVDELDRKNRFDPKFRIAPSSLAKTFVGLNSCGEIQGNGNVDMLIATLLAKREAFKALVDALGYRLN